MSDEPQHYALVSLDDGKHKSKPIPLPVKCQGRDPVSELTDLYETYADLYPNPKLTEEARQRDALLQAESAAQSFQRQQQQRSRGGFFSRWFGGGEEEQQAPEPSLQSNVVDPLIYSDILNEDNNDNSLCGTRRSIDLSCVPVEAYNVARLHLASTRAHREIPNACLWPPTTSNTPTVILVGLGEIVISESGNQTMFTTSDREALQQFALQETFELHLARGAALSSDCLVISWGFADGLTVIYRLVQDCAIWQSIWIMGPTQPVLESLSNSGTDLFHDTIDQPGSPLLKITCILPLQVETGVEEPPRVTTLALSRLGGFLELIPLPTAMWAGPPPQQPLPQTSRKRRGQQHYATDAIHPPPPQTLALTTCDYHTDVLSLQALRTSVNADTEWDSQAFPDRPPAEFLVVASGMSQRGDESLTFWTVSTLFGDSMEDGIGFQLHATLLDAVTSPSGPDVTVFCTPKIMNQWRTPRNVELRPTTSIGDDIASIPASKSSGTTDSYGITTLSTTAPIVSMRFCQGGFLALLDWNGGVSILDCGVMQRLAAQRLTPQEFTLHKTNNTTFPPLTTCLVSRHQCPISIQGKVTNLDWLEVSHDLLPPLVLLLSKDKNNRKRKLAIATFQVQPDNPVPKSHILLIHFPTSVGAAMKSSQDHTIEFVAFSHKKQGVVLKQFAMKQLEPVAIVESLAQSSEMQKLEEAIQAASKLEDIDQLTVSETVEECHKRLWEFKRDVDSLAETRNVSYIVQETLKLCHIRTAQEQLTLDTFRLVCTLAITMGRNYRPTKNKTKEICKYFVSLGTYQLLSFYFGVEPSLTIFFQHFAENSTGSNGSGTGEKLSVHEQLAKDLAQRGDIFALSIVLFRHKCDLEHTQILEILDKIPLSVSPESFLHLLPLIDHTSNDGMIADSFLSSAQEQIHLSHMPQYLAEVSGGGVAIVLDASDEKLVLDYNKSCKNNLVDRNFVVSLSDWFVDRAEKMQLFVGNFQFVIRFCEFGLRCITFSSTSTKLESSTFAYAPPGVQQLYKTWRSASSLQKMFDNGIVVPFLGKGEEKQEESEESTHHRIISTSDLLCMDLVDLVDLIFQGAEGEVLLSRCTEYLQPLISDIAFAADSNSVSASRSGLSTAVSTYCIGLAQKCGMVEATAKGELVAAARKALASCAAVATHSSTSIDKQNRLIQDKRALFEMIFSVTYDVSHSLERLERIKVTECKHLIEFLWRMYEALPLHVPSFRPSDAWLPFLEKSDLLYQDLVGMDVLSRWPECSPFVFYMNRERSRKHKAEQLTKADEDGGSDIIAQLCRSFCIQVNQLSHVEERVSLLHDLLSDVDQLNSICYEERPQETAAVVCTHLIRTLLYKEQFQLVAEYLKVKSRSADREHAKRAILSYVDESVFSETDVSTSIMSAMKCQDILGPVSPDLQPYFLSIRRYLDAAHFIANDIYHGKDRKPFGPSELRKSSPLDIIESVLQEIPESVIYGCPQWMDREFARDANKTLRQALDDKEGPEKVLSETENLPVLPGGAIFHLATILGLEDNISALIVKCRVVHYATTEGLHGAGAAISRTLIQEGDPQGPGSDAMSLAKISAVAEVVSDESYADLSTKKELCYATLHKFTGKISSVESEAFDAIIRVSANLDHRMSRFSREQYDLSAERHRILMSRPISRLYKHIHSEYNADVHALFSDMLGQTSNSVVHDSLMNALSRFVVYWCVSDSKTLKLNINAAETLDTRDNIDLGCSLILHIPSKLTAHSCVHELQGIASDQIAHVSSEERFGSTKDDICIPDPQIVRRLIVRGYSENAARRAAIMTRNQSYNDALGWAVTHTLDAGFNDPVLMLKLPNRKFIDEDSIQSLQKSLFVMNRFLKDSEPMASFIRSVSTMHQAGSPGISSQSIQKSRDGTKFKSACGGLMAPSAASQERDQQEVSLLIPPPLLGIQSKRIVDVSKNNSHERGTHIPHHHANGASVLQRKPPNTAQSQISYQGSGFSEKHVKIRHTVKLTEQNLMHSKPPHPPFSRVATKSGMQPTLNIAKPTRANNPSPSSGANPLSVVDRDALRKRGQAALVQLRSKGTTDERRRLIEEGRQLLRRAKANTPTAARQDQQSSRPRQLPPAPLPRPAPRGATKEAHTHVAHPTLSATKISKQPVADYDDGREDTGWDFDDFDGM